METAASDFSEPYDKERNEKTVYENVQMKSIINDIKVLLNKYKNPKNHVNDYLRRVEKKMEKENEIEHYIDRNKIRTFIEKHPYFKNPCNYHIRLLTIIKYLKKKGIDINIEDIDLLVDEIIQEIDGVRKVGEGKYIRTLNG